MPDSLRIPEIILASTSPRRAMLLKQVGIPFTVISPSADEATPQNGNFAEVVMRNAEAKARSVIGRAGGRLILGADTMVELDGDPLGKPGSPAQAQAMLRRLSGRTHKVHTGFAVIAPKQLQVWRDADCTRVTFRRLSDAEIDDYVRSGQPMDKAGAYGIQERGALFIRRVEGCFFNVIGLPLPKLWELLMKLKRIGAI